MPLSEIIRTDVVTIAPSKTAQEAALLLDKNNVGSLVVTEDDKPVGMITDRDLAIQVVADGRDPHEVTVADIMASPVHTASDDIGLVEAVDIMAEHAVRRLPVVGADGTLVGLITLDDVLTLNIVEMTLLEGVLLAQSKVGRSRFLP